MGELMSPEEASIVRGLARRRFGDVELSALHVASYLPVHALRIAIFRAFGLSAAKGVVVYHGATLRAARKITIGERSIIGDHATLDGRGGLDIGSDVNFSSEVSVWSAQHDWCDPQFGAPGEPVVIGHHAWLGARVTVLPGVTIGEGAVVGAGSIVSKDVPPWVLAVGQPARPVRDRPDSIDYRLGGARAKAWWW